MRHSSYTRNDHGIKKFAERCMGQLIRKVTKRSANYREMNETLMVEKANLRLRSDELHERPRLDPGEFFSMRRRLWANTFIVISFVIAAVFLNAISLTTLLGAADVLGGFLQWLTAAVLALVLTGGGLIITERLVESIYGEQESARLQNATLSVGVLWAILLVGIQLSILGIADAQARALATGVEGGLIYFGFITLAMALPVIAGAVRWDAMRYIDRYKVTQSLREIEGRLAQIDSLLRQNEEFESNYYKIKSIEYWDMVNAFKTYKDNYNEKHGITERIGGHFSQSYETFRNEANRRYQEDIRDATSKSMRKLAQTGSKTGSKIGQAKSGDGFSLPTPVEEVSQERSPEPDLTNNEGTETYLDPQPVR